jgi:hypothetical protein
MNYVPRKWRVVVQNNTPGFYPYLSRSTYLRESFSDCLSQVKDMPLPSIYEKRSIQKRDDRGVWWVVLEQTNDCQYPWCASSTGTTELVNHIQQLENMLDIVCGKVNPEIAG